MDWIVRDRRGHRWFPYILTTWAGKQNVLLHFEGADTDMGDMTMREVADCFGPVTVEPDE